MQGICGKMNMGSVVHSVEVGICADRNGVGEYDTSGDGDWAGEAECMMTVVGLF